MFVSLKLRDWFLLSAAVAAGIFLFFCLAVPTALLGYSLLEWVTNLASVPTGAPALAVAAIADVVAGVSVAAALLVVIAKAAAEPDRISFLLAISLPAIMVVALTVGMRDLVTGNALGFALRIFLVESLAFAATCWIAGRSFSRRRSEAKGTSV